MKTQKFKSVASLLTAVLFTTIFMLVAYGQDVKPWPVRMNIKVWIIPMTLIKGDWQWVKPYTISIVNTVTVQKAWEMAPGQPDLIPTVAILLQKNFRGRVTEQSSIKRLREEMKCPPLKRPYPMMKIAG